ncbi:MAG TPA: hypothetical protein VF951_14100 [Streptosporangiaceae bacterium]
MLDPAVMAALASPKRLQMLEWLRYPQTPSAPVRDGDLADDGVCVLLIATKLGVAQPTAATHVQAPAPGWSPPSGSASGPSTSVTTPRSRP